MTLVCSRTCPQLLGELQKCPISTRSLGIMSDQQCAAVKTKNGETSMPPQPSRSVNQG